MEDLISLVERAQQGQTQAREDLVRRFQDMAVGYAYSILGDFHEAQDAAQDAFVAALAALSTLQIPQAFPAWFRLVVFKQVDRRLRRSHSERLSQIPDIPSPAPDAQKLLEQSEWEGWLAEAVRGLPEEERMVTSLFYMGDYTHQQLSDFLEMPLATINNRLRSARSRLKKEILEMAEKGLRAKAPSRDDRFVNMVGLRSAIEAGDIARVRTLVDERPQILRHHGPLAEAAVAGHAEIVQILLDGGADPSFAHYGPRAEDQARELGHDAVVRVFERFHGRVLGTTDEAIALCNVIQTEEEAKFAMLVEETSDLDGTDADGHTPLHRAVGRRRHDWVSTLIDHGAGVDPQNHLVPTPLRLALNERDPDLPMARLLVEHGAQYDLYAACCLGDSDTVRRLLSESGYPTPRADAVPPPIHFFRPPQYPISGAASCGSTEVVQLLLETAQPDPFSKMGRDAMARALACAARGGHVEIVRLLLDAGQHPDGVTDHTEPDGTIKTQSGMPIQMAARHGFTDVARLLLDRGASPTSDLDSSGQPIDEAYGEGHTGVVDLLEQAGAHASFYILARYRPAGYLQQIEARIPTERDANPSLGLFTCMRQGNAEVVELLLRHDPEISSGILVGALWGPIGPHEDWMDKPKVVRLLLEHGIDLTSPEHTKVLHRLSLPQGPFGRHGTSALAGHYPERRLEVAAMLLDYGVDLEGLDPDFHSTALAWAAGKGDRPMVEFLLSRGALVEPVESDERTSPIGWAQRHGHDEIVDLLTSRIGAR